MAFQDKLQELKEFDISDLDFDNVGSWPQIIKIIAFIAVFIVCLGLGYKFRIADLNTMLAKEQQTEATLKADFEKKANKAANLEAYRKQMEEMEESFGALVAQLPTDTEVPGLLEDITSRGVENGLSMKGIKLLPEVAQEFYVELPIAITVSGSYHDFGAFVSGVAGLPRIVTLHDFSIKRDATNSTVLTMSVTAKTYRYKNEEGV